MNRLLALVVLSLLCLVAVSRAEESSFDKQLAEIAPKLGAEKESERMQPQKDLEKIEMAVSVPGKDAERSAYCNAVVAALGKELAVPAKLWLLRSLERVGRVESIPVEVKLVGDADETVRDAAIRALANNSAEESGRVVASMLLKTSEPKTRAALINALGYKKVPGAEKLLANDTTNADEGVRNSARSALAKIGHRADAGAMAEAAALIDMGRAAQAADIAKIIAALDSTNVKVRQAAVQAAGLNASPEMTNAIADKLKSVDTNTKIGLLAVLSKRSGRIPLPPIFEEAKNPDNAVKIAAVRAIGTVEDGTPQVPTFLMSLIGNSSDDVQRAVRECLDLMHSGSIDQTLIGYLTNAEAALRAEAAQRLGMRQAAIAAPAISKLLNDADAKPRTEALKALAMTGGKNELDAVIAVVLKSGSDADRDQAAKTALAISRRLPADSRADAIIAALKNAPDNAQVQLLNILGQLGGAKALSTVREAVKSAGQATQDGAVRALASWVDAEALGDNLTVAKSTTNDVHRVLALRGYFRLAGLSSARPAKETTALFLEGLAAAKKTDDKKMALAGLADVDDFAAFKKCNELVNDAEVTEEACAAAVKSARFFLKTHGSEVSAALQIVAEKSKNPATKKQASELKNKAAK